MRQKLQKKMLREANPCSEQGDVTYPTLRLAHLKLIVESIIVEQPISFVTRVLIHGSGIPSIDKDWWKSDLCPQIVSSLKCPANLDRVESKQSSHVANTDSEILWRPIGGQVDSIEDPFPYGIFDR